MRLAKPALISAAALFLLMGVAAPGCNTADLQAYCEEVGSCEGYNAKDIEACVVIQESREYVDCDLGCGDEHVAYYDCLLEKGSCMTEGQGNPCATNDDCNGFGQCGASMQCELRRFTLSGDDCKAEREAYQSCSFN